LITDLKNHVARAINWLDFDVFNNTPFSIDVPATGSYSAFLGTNRKQSQATYGELGPGGVAMTYDTFKKSGVTPYTDRGLYVMISNGETFRNLKQGSVFQNLQIYQNLQGIKYQILGEFSGFLFVETIEQTGKGTTHAFGRNVGGYGYGQLPSVYYYPDFMSDAGRMPVWKIVFYRGQGPIYRNKGTACIQIHSSSGNFNYGALG
jgi:hypothetical protein